MHQCRKIEKYNKNENRTLTGIKDYLDRKLLSMWSLKNGFNGLYAGIWWSMEIACGTHNISITCLKPA